MVRVKGQKGKSQGERLEGLVLLPYEVHNFFAECEGSGEPRKEETSERFDKEI